MPKTLKSSVYKINSYISLFIFCLISFGWLLKYNQYHVIQYMEDTQLFRSDIYYFQDYMKRPAGLIEYAGSFLTQFYYYNILGAVILTLAIVSIPIALIIINNKEGAISRYFVLPISLALCLLFVVADVNVTISYYLGMLLALLAFYIYGFVNGRFRYLAGLLLYLLVYFAAGGNAILFAFFLIVSELRKGKKSYIYLIAIVVVASLVPYLGYELYYHSTLKLTYFALTPFGLKGTNTLLITAWIGVMIIDLILKFFSKKHFLKNIKPLKALTPSYLILAVFTVWGVYSYTDKDSEFVAEMAYNVEHANWDEVLEMKQTNGGGDMNDYITSYFANIALSEKGELASRMFEYHQTGMSGLLLGWHVNYSNFNSLGEIYYRLGIIPEAEHCAYEAMVLSPRREHGAKPLKRLVYTTMLRGDIKGFEKYIGFFENSLIYKKWAEEQKVIFANLQRGSKEGLEDFPFPKPIRNVFINHGNPEHNLIQLLNSNLDSKKVFEYFLAFIFLEKEIETLEIFLDKYYSNLKDSELPRHCQEALILYKHTATGAENILNKYPVDSKLLQEYDKFIKLTQLASSKTGMENMKNQYGNTYWFYHFYLNSTPASQSMMELIY